ncbi:VanZ family protein [Caulobacter sp.]|uniref:VanZ family protein n=1 Tax=Caulobacter sp. TaxID=78 RepID=UPI003BAD9F3F
MPFRNRKINALAFAIFVAAAAFALWRALLPDDGGLSMIPWDKAKHFIVFYVLTALAITALPASRFWRIGVVLLAFGGLIEVLQAFVGRDAAWGDVLADACGIGALFGPIVLRDLTVGRATLPIAPPLEVGQVLGQEVKEPL